MILTIPYTGLPSSSQISPQDVTYYPIVNTSLEYRNRRLGFDFPCIIDSGADHCIFPSSIGRELGISLESGVKGPLFGVGGSGSVYYHEIKVYVTIEDKLWNFTCLAGFTSGLDEWGAGLLGRRGFFELFDEVTFDQKTKAVKLVFE